LALRNIWRTSSTDQCYRTPVPSGNPRLLPRIQHLLTTLLLAVQLRGGVIDTEVGDAGSNLPSAQIIYGSGPLNQIVGVLKGPNDTSPLVDIFEIYVSDPRSFSAFTSGGVPDPALFLFDINGYGYEGGRDMSSTDKQGFLTGDPSSTSPPLAVYLWISVQDREPGCGGASMFGAGGTQYPNPAGTTGSCTSTGPIGGENGANSPGSNYAYTITLTGASFVQVPESASVSLLALGLLAFATRRLRR
jgi:hypothetical protein